MTRRTASCQWCHCTERRACKQGCSWAANGTDLTLCTACVWIAMAWSHLRPTQRKGNMRRAFFRGYLAATGDLRRDALSNPYGPDGVTAKYWDMGFRAGDGHMRARRLFSQESLVAR